MKKVNILKLMETVANQMRAESLLQYKEVYNKDGHCFYCSKSIKATEIIQELKDCVLCPYCGIDAVIPTTANITITPEMLRMFNLTGFKTGTSIEGDKLTKVLFYTPTLEDNI